MGLRKGFRRTRRPPEPEEGEFRLALRELWEANRRSLRLLSALSAAVFALLALLGCLEAELLAHRRLYLGCGCASLLILLLAGKSAKGRPAVIGLLMYAFLAMLLGFGIYLGTVDSPHELTAAYIALLLTAPQMFLDRPWRMLLLLSASAAAFVALCLCCKDRETWSGDLTNAAVFAPVSAVCCVYRTRLRLERLRLEARTRILAETDRLTGLKNRVSYEAWLRRAKDRVSESYYAVYVDVNGLHGMNDAFGHAAGDALLRRVARELCGVFGAERCYRIGGDEFVALGADRTRQEVAALAEELRTRLQARGCHAASGMGWRSRDTLDVSALIREAERNMYADKSRYYRESGLERRR